MILIIAGSGIVLVVLGFFAVRSGLFGSSFEAQQTDVVGGNAQEATLKLIEGNVSDLREELQNDFYKSLKRYAWPTNTAAPGKKNPFVE